MLVGSTALTLVYSKNWPVRALGGPYSGRITTRYRTVLEIIGAVTQNIDAGWKKWLIAHFPPFQLGAMIALKSADLPECTQDLRIVPGWKYGCGRTTSMPVGKLIDCARGHRPGVTLPLQESGCRRELQDCRIAVGWKRIIEPGWKYLAPGWKIHRRWLEILDRIRLESMPHPVGRNIGASWKKNLPKLFYLKEIDKSTGLK
jgi:hypothetical protein